MSSLIELIEFDSTNNNNKSLKPIKANGVYSSINNKNYSKNISIQSPHQHSSLSSTQYEAFPTNSKFKNKRNSNVDASLNNNKNLAFNYSSDLFNKKDTTQLKQEDLESPIIWNKLNKALNNTYTIEANTPLDKKNTGESPFNNSTQNSINSINTLNRNVSSAANLNQIGSEKVDVIKKSSSYLNANDEQNQVRHELITNSISNLNNNSINNSNNMNSSNQADVIFSSSQRHFCLCCCCCLDSNEKANTPGKNLITNNDKFQNLMLYLKRMLSNFKTNTLGLALSTIISFTFVIMTYMLRNSLNLIEMSSAHSQNKVSNDTFLNQTFSFNIESRYKRSDFNCDYCFLIVWTATSSLVFVYPVFFLLYCSSYKKKTKSARLVEAIQKSKNQEILVSLNDVNNGKPPRRRKAIKSPYLLLLSESLKVFNTKKKRGETNTLSSCVSSSSNGKSDSGNFDHLKLKRFLFVKSVAVSLLWILTGYTYIRAINLLYCSDVIILFSVNFAFVFITSWIILHNKFIPIRLIGFILAFSAIIFTYYSEGLTLNSRLLGKCCATMSSIGSALLQVIWKNNTENKENNQRAMFLTLIGLCNLLFFWPFIFLFYYSGLETLNYSNLQLFSNIYKNQIIFNLAGATLLAFAYIFLLLFGSLFSKEIFLQIGRIFCIPISLIMDTHINKLELSDFKLGAFLCILIGYIFLILPENMYADCREKYFPQSREEVETHSLTRRYKYQTSNPSPILNALKKIPSKPSQMNTISTAKIT